MEKFTGKAFEAFGEWYFTHIPDQPFVGILNFDPESGLELRVVDSMRKQGFGAWKPANRKEERISGISTPWIGLEYRRPQNLEKAMAEISSGARLISVLSGFELSSTVFFTLDSNGGSKSERPRTSLYARLNSKSKRE